MYYSINNKIVSCTCPCMQLTLWTHTHTFKKTGPHKALPGLNVYGS